MPSCHGEQGVLGSWFLRERLGRCWGRVGRTQEEGKEKKGLGRLGLTLRIWPKSQFYSEKKLPKFQSIFQNANHFEFKPNLNFTRILITK
jgi:hypothetical protein